MNNLKQLTRQLDQYQFDFMENEGELEIYNVFFDHPYMMHAKLQEEDGRWFITNFPFQDFKAVNVYESTAVEKFIISHYYDYYLVRKSENPNLIVPKIWQDRYEQVGLKALGNEAIKTLKVKAVAEKLLLHVYDEVGTKDLNFWQSLSQDFNDCLYEGPAVRITLKKQEEVDLNRLKSAGNSWSKTLNGTRAYLEAGSGHEEGDPITVVEGQVRGFSVKCFCEKYADLVPELKNPALSSEEEIIALEVLGVEKIYEIYSLADLED